MYFVLQGADFSQANLGQIEIELGSIGTGGTIDPNAKYTLTVNVNVEGATIKLTPEGGSTTTTNGTSGTIEVTYNTKVNIEVSKEDYNSYNRELTITRDRELSVTLTPIASTTQYTLTITPDPSDATVTLSATGYSTVSGTGSQSITVANGTKVNWSVSASDYTTRTGDWTISDGNKTESIKLVASGGTTTGVTIDVATRTTTNPYAQALPTGTTSATNLWTALTPEAKYYDSTGAYTNYNRVSSITFPVKPGDKITASSFGTTKEFNGTSHAGIRITYLLDATRVSTLSADQVSTEYKANGYVTVPSGVNAVNIPVWDNTKTDNEVYLFPAEATSGTPTKPSNFDNTGSGSGGSTPGGDGVQDTSGATWYVNHLANGSKCTVNVNIAGRGWSHVPGSAAYNAYVGKPVNTIGFFTNKASQNVTIGKVTENGGVDAMETIATVTAVNPSGATKGFCYITFPTVTLAQGECLAMFAQDDDNINFYYSGSSSLTDANGIVDTNFYGRVPKVYGSGTAWTSYPSQKICLGISVGYIAS